MKKSNVISGVLSAAFLLTACSYNPKDFNSLPAFSPVRGNLGYGAYLRHKYAQPGRIEGGYSLFKQVNSGFFRDPRAKQPGDIVTVLISINDRAKLTNKSNIDRDNKAQYGIGASFGFLRKSAPDIHGSSSSHSLGDAKVQRNEDIQLSIAAIVTDVLPNGNLVIDGSQEVRVNYELRVLNITGVVRPRDISGDNTIAYDKIAEARISYGGRGRMSEIQQPPYGQQFFNQVAPF